MYAIVHIPLLSPAPSISALQTATVSYVVLPSNGSLHGSGSETSLSSSSSSSSAPALLIASPPSSFSSTASSCSSSTRAPLYSHYSSSLRSLGLPPADVVAIINALPLERRSKYVEVSFQHLLALVLFLRSIGVDTSKFAALVKKAPFMYQRDPTEHLEPKIAYLETLGVDRKEMHVLILKYPYSLYPSIEDIRTQVQFLRDLPLSDDVLQKVIRQCPMAFRLGAVQYLQPKVELFKSLGITQRDMVRVVLTFPRVFARPLEKLRGTVEILKEYGFEPGTPSFSKAFICVSTRDTDCVRLVVEKLLDSGLSQEQITALIQEVPLILAKNSNDVHNKVKYLVDVMERPIIDVLRCPAFFLLSLEGRLKPRHEAFLKWKAGRNFSKQLSLAYIFSPSDEVFSRRFPGIQL